MFSPRRSYKRKYYKTPTKIFKGNYYNKKYPVEIGRIIKKSKYIESP